MRWVRRFAVGAAVSALAAALLSLVVEPSLALVVGLAGIATGAVMAFGRRADAAAGTAPEPGAGRGSAADPEPGAGSGAGTPRAPS